MSKGTTVHTKSTELLKEETQAILQELGIPIELRTPNKTTIKAMEEAREGKGKRYARVEEMFTDLDV